MSALYMGVHMYGIVLTLFRVYQKPSKLLLSRVRVMPKVMLTDELHAGPISCLPVLEVYQELLPRTAPLEFLPHGKLLAFASQSYQGASNPT